MNFSSALLILQEGKKLRRDKWPINGYIFISSYESIIKLHHPEINGTTNWIIYQGDLLADDWEIYIKDKPQIDLNGLYKNLRDLVMKIESMMDDIKICISKRDENNENT